jgi:uncharacterized membrane protein
MLENAILSYYLPPDLVPNPSLLRVSGRVVPDKKQYIGKVLLTILYCIIVGVSGNVG